MIKLNGRLLYWSIFFIIISLFVAGHIGLFAIHSGAFLHIALIGCNTVFCFGYGYFQKEIKKDFSI
jgi:hypothetical protein